ncbi:MAG: methyltransferase domain-containing protein [Gammaproteobacteria bacterium]|nr:methyltransferase domain-containing protein [Gammaproteobacteria bacterium]
MAAAYDAIAREYQRSKSSPLRAAIECWTIDRLLGDIRGAAIFDAGCGEGFHARRLKTAGAARIAGVDVSPAMIELAREAERHSPLGIQYQCCAVEELPELPCAAAFDVVLAAWLLHYSPSFEVLQRMCLRLANVLKPGGRLVALCENPDQTVDDYAGYAAYGFDKFAAEPRAEGSRIAYSLVAGRQMIRFDTHYYARSSYERALRAAGFTAIAWHPLQLDPAADGADWYAAYLRNPPVLGLTAVLSGVQDP